VGPSAVPAAYSKNLHLVLIVVFEVVAVSGVAAPGPTSCTDHPSQNRGPMRIQFRKAIVGNGNVEYYYCIVWGSRAAFYQGLLPGFFYPFFQVSDTVIRQFLLFPQIIGRASTRESGVSYPQSASGGFLMIRPRLMWITHPRASVLALIRTG
jgi:hypothetical protein